MTFKILSEIVTLPIEFSSDNDLIEKVLEERYSDVIRWAIVDLDESSIKISLSYRINN